MHEALRKPLDREQIDGYLARIGMKRENQLTADYLDRIVKAQLRTIPFDDADVWARRACPSLATDDLYNKIITGKRGGYCFELNSLFQRFLSSLGFDAYLVIIHLGRPNLNGELNYPSHCGVIITIDGVKRFADVGYGGPVPDGSVPLTGEEVLGHRKRDRGVYTVVESKNPDGSFFGRFTFKDCPCDPVEIIPLNYYISQNPSSVFAADLKMNIRADDGFAEIGGKTFKYRSGSTVIEKAIESPAEAAALALEYFGVPELPVREF